MARLRRKLNIKLRHKRRARLLCMALLVVLLSAALVFAAYTNQGFKKGVLSTDRGAARFSSDVLMSYQEGGVPTSKTQIVPFSTVEGSENAGFSIFNYPFGNRLQYNSADITYNIVFEIIGSETAAKPSVQVNNGGYVAMTGMSQSFTHTLASGAAAEMNYSIRFPGEAIGQYQLQVTATPSDAASKRAAQHQVLSCLYVPVLRAETQVTELSASGEFTDERGAYTPDKYHAFNYRISLQNYTGTVTLTWDNTLQPDPFFLQSLGIPANTRSLVLNVTEATENYEFVFYRTEIEFADPADWDELDAAVSFTASE